MRSRILLLSCSLTLLGGGNVSAKAAPQVEWEKTLNFPTAAERSEAVQLIRQDPKGGYLTATMSGNLITVWKIKPSGELDKKISYTKAGLTNLNFFKQMNDGSYLVSGETNTIPIYKQFFTIHLSETGEKLWETKEDTNMAEDTPDNGYVLVKNNGPTVYSPDPLNDVVLTKVDKNGSTEWVHNIEKPNGIDVIVFDAHRTSDGATAITGKYEWSTGTEIKADLYLAKIDEKGNLLWELQHDSGKDTYAFSLTEAEDGSLIAAGDDGHFHQPSQEHTGYLLKVDKDGKPVWEKRYNADSIFQDIEIMKNGHYLVAGTANYHRLSNYTYEGDEYLQEISPSGNVVWSSITEGGDQVRREGNAIEQSEDGGYLAVGSSYTSTEGVRAVHLTKLHRGNDSTGDTLALDAPVYQLSVGQSVYTQLIADNGGNQKNVTSSGHYSIADPAIASVNQAGKLTGLNNGETVLMAVYGGNTATAKVQVKGALNSSIRFDSEDYSVVVGQTLDAHLYMLNGGKLTEVTSEAQFEFSDPTIASIDKIGSVTGLKYGVTEMTASYRGMKVTCKVYVY